MNKTAKTVIIVLVSILLVVSLLVGIFFIVFPNHPKVQIKSAEDRINTKDKILVASYNTAAPWGNIALGTGSVRRSNLFAKQVNDIMPDTLGVQEMNSFWVEWTRENLPQYEYYGVKRGGDENERKSEMSGIFYLKDKFQCIENNTFWISYTPEKESEVEGAGCYRVCSYVVLKDKETGNMFAHLNTHLDNSSEEAQNLGGELIYKKSIELSEKYPQIKIVVTGDFNQYVDGKACTALLNNGFKNVSSVDSEKKDLLTYHGWGSNEYEGPIDFIMVNDGFVVNSYNVEQKKINHSYASDHYMITAELSF